MGIRLDKIIVFQKKNTEEDVVDEEGYEIPPWSFLKKVMAKANNLYGKEFWNAKAIKSEQTVEFTIRYVRELDNINTREYRIIYNEKPYDIQFIDNVRHENSWLKIKAINRP